LDEWRWNSGYCLDVIPLELVRILEARDVGVGDFEVMFEVGGEEGTRFDEGRFEGVKAVSEEGEVGGGGAVAPVPVPASAEQILT